MYQYPSIISPELFDDPEKIEEAIKAELDRRIFEYISWDFERMLFIETNQEWEKLLTWMMDLVRNHKCNGFKVSNNQAEQIGSAFNDMGTWVHTVFFSIKCHYWEFRFYNTSLNWWKQNIGFSGITMKICRL